MSRSLAEPVLSAFEPTSSEIGLRLDRVLLTRFPELSRRIVGLAIAEGRVLINGKRAKKAMNVGPGDRVELQMHSSLAAGTDPDAPLDLSFQDDHLLIVNKPAGRPCHGLQPGERGTLVAAVLARFPGLASVGDDPREPGLVHRLDTDTSGLVLLARDQPTWIQLRAMLRAEEIDKTYVARCAPLPAANELTSGVHEAMLRANRGARVRVSSDPLGKDSRVIRTEVLETTPLADGTVLVRTRIHRAARHQVRAHLAHLGYPLVGDTLYGGPKRQNGHLLHADTLQFIHPVYRKAVAVVAEVPAGFVD